MSHVKIHMKHVCASVSAHRFPERRPHSFTDWHVFQKILTSTHTLPRSLISTLTPAGLHFGKPKTGLGRKVWLLFSEQALGGGAIPVSPAGTRSMCPLFSQSLIFHSYDNFSGPAVSYLNWLSWRKERKKKNERALSTPSVRPESVVKKQKMRTQ